jgi:integrase
MWSPLALLHRLSGPTWTELVADYYRSPAFLDLSPSSQRPYCRVIDRWLTMEGLRECRVRGLTRVDIEAMMARRSPGAANDLLKKLRILTRFAIWRGARRDDPTLGIRRYRAGDGHHTWTDSELARFSAHWPMGTRERLAFELLLCTAQRRSDVVRMGRADIVGGRLMVRQRKTRAELAIPLHAHLQAALAGAPAGVGTFLVTSFGKPFTAAGFGLWMADRIAEAGLPDRCVTHGLRKAAARRLAEAGCSTREIAAITGHATLREIERYTAKANQERLAAQAMARVAIAP